MNHCLPSGHQAIREKVGQIRRGRTLQRTEAVSPSLLYACLLWILLGGEACP